MIKTNYHVLRPLSLSKSKGESLLTGTGPKGVQLRTVGFSSDLWMSYQEIDLYQAPLPRKQRNTDLIR